MGERNFRKSKYDLLNDRDWLYKAYVTDQKQIKAIAAEVGCYPSNVRKYIVSHGIGIIPKKRSKSKYRLLNDEKWLRLSYFDEGKSLVEISNIIGCSSSLVNGAFAKFSITARAIRDSRLLHREGDGFVLTSGNSAVLEGSLLGDGSLRKLNPTGFPSFLQACIKKDYMELLESILCPEASVSRISEREAGKIIKGKSVNTKNIFTFSTLVHEEFIPYFERFYPEAADGLAGLKRIPRDLVVEPVTLLHWFLGDGFSCFDKRRKQKLSVSVGLCTQGFIKEDVDLLQQILMRDLGLKFYIRKSGSYSRDDIGFGLYLTQKQSDQFYAIIGPPPIKSLAYKWKLPPYNTWFESN